jgi:hypothetical protein
MPHLVLARPFGLPADAEGPNLSLRTAKSAPAVAFPAPARAPHVEDDEDDENIDLPPLDADEDDETREPEELDDLVPALREDSGDPFDDANAQDLDVGGDLEGVVDETLDEDASDEPVDIGPMDEGISAFEGASDSTADDEATAETHGDDDDLLDRLVHDDDDGGAEGTGENVENDVDEAALPELDASDQDEGDDQLAYTLLEEASTGLVPPWAASRWGLIEGAGATVPCVAVTSVGGRVLAAGDVVLAVDEGAHAARQTGLAAASTAIAANDETTVVATARGGLMVSRDGGASGSPVAGFRSGKSPATLAATPGRIWILQEGALWSITGPDGAPVPVRDSGILAMAASGGTVVACAARVEGPAIERLRGDDEGWQATPLPEGMAELFEGGARPGLAAAASGRRIAIWTEKSLFSSADGGRSFMSIELPFVVAACFAGDDEESPLLALVAHPGEAVGYLVRVIDDEDPARVGELQCGGDGATFGEAHLAWDGARELAWVACRAGLLAFGPARRH